MILALVSVSETIAAILARDEVLPIPMALVGNLAVKKSCQGMGIGQLKPLQ
jgi:predicted N-acetyltransferase YhbS